MSGKRILFFPDKISDDDSGARSARVTLRTLLELGHTVSVFTADADKVPARERLPNVGYLTPHSTMGARSHFHEPALLRQFRQILADFRPDFFFMAGSIQKPAMLAREARRSGVRTIFLFYITDYYCMRSLAGLADGPCLRCIEHTYVEALRHGCVRKRPVPVHFTKGALVRRQLRHEILRSHRVAGYSDDQLGVYAAFGVDRSRLAQISLQFDPHELDGVPTGDGEYILMIGQPIIQKGWHTLAPVLARCTSAPKILMTFRDIEAERRALREFGLESFAAAGIIRTERALVEREAIIRVIANARAVMIPSYYPTTGEFVLQESLLLGKPVLVFAAGAHKNLITHRRNGMIAPVGDIEAFARHLDEVNTDAALRASLRAGARALTATLYDDDARLASVGALFE